MLYTDPPTKGRVVVDTGFTKLGKTYWNTTAGTERYVRNVAVWLLNVERRALPKLNIEEKAEDFSHLERGQEFTFEAGMGKIKLGLGWSSKLDLDASVILYNGSRAVVDTVFYGHLTSKGIKHSGDILSGTTGINDDEQIDVNLLELDDSVTALLFIVNVFSQGQTFKVVDKAYVRLVDVFNRQEKCRYTIDKSALSLNDESGLVMCKVYRPKDDPGRWKLVTIGQPVAGRRAQEAKGLEKYLPDNYLPEGANVSLIV